MDAEREAGEENLEETETRPEDGMARLSPLTFPTSSFVLTVPSAAEHPRFAGT